jgi:hypothetical protein
MDKRVGTAHLPGSERPRPAEHRHVGPVNASTWIGVTVLVRARPGSPPVPGLQQWQDTPFAERTALTREEYAHRHGADPADLEEVRRFAEGAGLQVTETHAGRRSVTVEGTADRIGAAFSVELQEFEALIPRRGRRQPMAAGTDPGSPQTYRYHGHDGPVSIPGGLHGVVVAVVGLDSRIRTAYAGGPPATGANDPPGTASLSVPQIAAQYNFPTSGAADQTIGVFAPTSATLANPNPAAGGAAFSHNDILNSYFPSLPAGWTGAPTLNDIQLIISGQTYINSSSLVTSANGAASELTQDVSTSSTIAQNATVNVYFNDGSEQGWLVFLNRVLLPEGEKGPSVVTVSFTLESGDDSSYIGGLTSDPLTSSSSIVDWMTRQFQSLAAVGVDVFIALGDWGSDDWWPLASFPPNPPVAPPDALAHVMYPGSDPWVTSCGGTVVGASSEEWAWGDAFTSGGQGFPTTNFGSTGGGISRTFPIPGFQAPAGVDKVKDSAGATHSGRGVPDVAGMVALTGFWLAGSSYGFTGTSCVAPLYAGLAAVIKSAVGRDLGPWNQVLYAVGETAFNDITKGNNNSNATQANVQAAFTAAGETFTGTVTNAPYFSAGPGWDACTGLGSIDGTKLLNGISSLIYNQSYYFQVNKGSFGLDEVNITSTFSSPTPMWLVLEGFTPAAVSAAGITPTVISSVPGITVTAGTGQPEIESAQNTPQRIYYPCTVSFSASAVATISNGGIFPEPGAPPTPTQVTLLAPSVEIAGQIIPAAETLLTLEPGADPYFANFATDGEFYFSQDLRVFTVTPGIAALKAPIDGIALNASGTTDWDTAAAYTYIQTLLDHLNTKYSDPGTTDPFSLFPDQTNALSGDSSVTPYSIDPSNPTGPGLANYNFAVARVRLDGKPGSSSGANVRVLCRLFTTQTSDTDYQELTYPSTLDAEGQPLHPQVADGNITVPFFATGNYESNSDYHQNADYSGTSINNQPVEIGSSGTTWAYYGCYINIYPTANTIGGVPVQNLFPSAHSCVVAQLVYDDAPYPAGPGLLMGPEFTDNFAQRNLQITFSDNPGPPAAHRIPQTFDVRPGPALGSEPIEDYPDELMISWGDTPVGSTASIYWPAVSSTDVMALADELYSTHQLSATDAHTITCTVPRGITSVPIPSGTGPNYAGLFTVDLPAGVTTGQVYTVTVRRISSRQQSANGAPVAQGAVTATAVAGPSLTRSWRYVVGSFAVRIPVTTGPVMKPYEENTISILRWRLSQMAPSNRWVPVLERYLGLLEQRLAGIGGDPAKIVPGPYGVTPVPNTLAPAPGPGRRPHPGHGPGRDHDHLRQVTGKITGVVYDRFGDFEGFHLLSEHGAEHHYRSREAEIEELVRFAWEDRVLITVLSDFGEAGRPVRIVLRQAPLRR